MTEKQSKMPSHNIYERLKALLSNSLLFEKHIVFFFSLSSSAQQSFPKWNPVVYYPTVAQIRDLFELGNFTCNVS